MRNSESAHLVAVASRGRLKECNQTRPLKVFFGLSWLSMISSCNLEANPTAQNSFWSLSFQDLRKSCETLQVCNHFN